MLGRLASHVAILLRGKHKATFAPHMDMGDFVIIINAEKVALTGRSSQKKAYRHSGYPGGLRPPPTPSCSRSTRPARSRRPFAACSRRTRSAAPSCSKLKVYTGAEHPHAAQQPKTYTLAQVAQ